MSHNEGSKNDRSVLYEEQASALDCQPICVGIISYAPPYPKNLWANREYLRLLRVDLEEFVQQVILGPPSPTSALEDAQGPAELAEISRLVAQLITNLSHAFRSRAATSSPRLQFCSRAALVDVTRFWFVVLLDRLSSAERPSAPRNRRPCHVPGLSQHCCSVLMVPSLLLAPDPDFAGIPKHRINRRQGAVVRPLPVCAGAAHKVPPAASAVPTLQGLLRPPVRGGLLL